MAAVRRRTVQTVYRRLFETYGPQDWWPGETVFEIMVGAVLTQNTAWSNVEKAIANLLRVDALSPERILTEHPRRVANWLRPSGYFNVKTKRLRAMCRWILDQGGVQRLARLATPALRTALLSVKGIGPETADDILLYAFDRPVFVIDAYTRRIFRRLGAIDGDEHYDELRGWFESALGPDAALYNEYHALLVVHGKDICRTRPACARCCLRRQCARNGVPGD